MVNYDNMSKALSKVAIGTQMLVLVLMLLFYFLYPGSPPELVVGGYKLGVGLLIISMIILLVNLPDL